MLQNLSETNLTLLNNKVVNGEIEVKHGDVFTICDRSFRFERFQQQQKAISPKIKADIPPNVNDVSVASHVQADAVVGEAVSCVL